MKAGKRLAAIEARLTEAFQPTSLLVVDESHKHVGHAGARDGHGHFRVTITAAEFAGMSMIARHRAIYAAMGELMQSDIHALSIEAQAPGEPA
jgi:BolA protein